MTSVPTSESVVIRSYRLVPYQAATVLSDRRGDRRPRVFTGDFEQAAAIVRGGRPVAPHADEERLDTNDRRSASATIADSTACRYDALTTTALG